jgi:outer membrane protein
MKKMVISMLVFSLFTFGTALGANEAPGTNKNVQNATIAFIDASKIKSSSIGFIDVNRIMKESPQVKVLQEQLDQIGKELSNKLEGEKAKLTPEEFTKNRKAYYAEFIRVKKEKERQIDSNIKLALEKVAKEKNLVMIIYKNAATPDPAGVDVTVDVMNKMK